MKKMKNFNVKIGMSILMVIMVLSCQKNVLKEPQLNDENSITDSTKTLSISTDSTKRTINLTDDVSITKAASITVDYLKTFAAKAGDSDYFILKTTTTWQIASYPSWVTVSPLSGTGNANVTVTVKENTGVQRTGTISISGTGVTQNATINIIQLAGSSTGTITVDYLKTFSSIAGDSDYFKITSNTTWNIASFPSWVSVNPMSGTGNANVTVTVQANTGAQRTGSIVISGTGVAQNATINALQVAGAVVQSPTQQANYYIAVNGSDNNAGTIDKPFASLNGAWKVVQPGTLIYMRGGTYSITTQQLLSGKSGTPGKLIKIWAYPGETPKITKGSGYSASHGIFISNSNYIHIKGLEITGFTQPTSGGNVGGLYIEPSNYSIFELINYHHNGFPLTATHASTGNLFLNCDFHHNYDPYTSGDKYGNADGVNCEFDPGTSNVFRGCRSWWNSDDGFDFYRCDGYVEFDNCWAWHNGYKEDGVSAAGNGTGFKLGITRADFSTQLLRYVHNCLAWDGRQGGFYQADGKCIMKLYNNTSYKNTGDTYTCGFGFSDFAGIPHIIKNNIALDEMVAYWGQSAITHDHNSWDNGIGVSANDFISLDQTGTNGARKADGSLPDINFLKLKTTSKLYQKGVNVGLPFSGSAPNVGVN